MLNKGIVSDQELIQTLLTDYRYYAIVNTVEVVILNESNREFFRKGLSVVRN